MAGLPFHSRDDPGQEGLCSVLGDYQCAQRCLCNPDFGLLGPAAQAVILVSGEPSHQHLTGSGGTAGHHMGPSAQALVWWEPCSLVAPPALDTLGWLYTATALALEPEDVIQRGLQGKGPVPLCFSLFLFTFLSVHLCKAFPGAIMSTANKPSLCFLAVLSDFSLSCVCRNFLSTDGVSYS